MPVQVKVSKLFFVTDSGERNAASVVFRQEHLTHPVSGYMNCPAGSFGIIFNMPGDGEVEVEPSAEGGPKITVQWEQELVQPPKALEE